MIWSKSAFIIKVGLSFTAFLAACGGGSSSKAEPSDIALREVSTIYDLGACTADRYGDTVFVYDKAVDYLCVNNDWLDITTPLDNLTLSDNQSDEPESGLSSFIDEDVLSSSSFVDDPIRNDSNTTTPTQQIDQDYAVVPTKEKLPTCSSDNDKQCILVQTDSILYTCLSKKWEPKDSKGYVVKDASILGAAQKGPFKVKSSLSLSEVLLRNDTLVYSGRKYNDEISSNKGDFVIPKVCLIYPYAVLEVRGLWRNEISGDYSKDSMTLRVLTDLSKRTEVNINLLTHLEYDRAVKLVNKGYNVYAAKKQAEHEIMTAFGFATTVEYSEDLKTFVPSTNTSHNANATLMAISLLFIADKNDVDIQKSINDFRSDFAEDGSWDNEQMKANMADWAEAFDGGSIHANVKNWNILDIPKYENFLTIFWNNAYGIGGCDQTRYGVVSPVSNKSSKNYKVHYICKENGWIKASDYEKDTYGWGNGEDGEVKKGNVTATYYIFENGKWSVAKNETTLGVCSTERNGELAKFDTTYFICKNGKWNVATIIEYDTYQFGNGEDGEVRAGKINTNKYYVYEDNAWRESANEIENQLGACVTSRKGEMDTIANVIYICKSKNWTSPNKVELTSGGCTADRINARSYDESYYYICTNNGWTVVSWEEYHLGYCRSDNKGTVERLSDYNSLLASQVDTFFICKSNKWVMATELEYDTYGWEPGYEGEVRPGSVKSWKHYVFENGEWRKATNVIEYGYGVCIADRVGEKRFIECGYYEDLKRKVEEKEYYICTKQSWKQLTLLEYDTYGLTCSKNNSAESSIIDGLEFPENKYICEEGKFRALSETELSIGQLCTNEIEYTTIRKVLSDNQDSVYVCRDAQWDGIVSKHIAYDSLTDERDDRIYKTITIGNQTWMAENLNFGCTSCAGRYSSLYKWSVAIDSANREDSQSSKIQGVCPKGWHVPDVGEWNTLFSNIGGKSTAGEKLKSQLGWLDNGNGLDEFGFYALPIGKTSDVIYPSFGYETGFWCADEDGGSRAYVMRLDNNKANATLTSYSTKYKFAVRCIKD